MYNRKNYLLNKTTLKYCVTFTDSQPISLMVLPIVQSSAEGWQCQEPRYSDVAVSYDFNLPEQVARGKLSLRAIFCCFATFLHLFF